MNHIYISSLYISIFGFPGGSEDKVSACNAGDPGLIPGLGGSPGEGNGNPLQYSCLENPMERGAWRATVHGVAKSRTRLNDLYIYPLPFGLPYYSGHCSALSRINHSSKRYMHLNVHSSAVYRYELIF